MATVAIDHDEEQRLDAQAVDWRAQFAAGVTRAAAIGVSAIAVLSVVSWLVTPAYVQFLVTAVQFLPIIVTAFLYPFFRRQGRSVRGIRLFVWATFLVLLTIPLVLPAPMASGTTFVLLVITGFQLLGSREGLWLGVASALGVTADIAVFLFWSPAWFVPLPPEMDLVNNAGFALAVFLLAVVLIRLIMVGQEKQFREARRATMEVERRIAAEQSQRERLQQANEEVERGIRTERERRQQLQRLILQVREAADLQGRSAAEIVAATTQQASGATEQSAAIAQATATIDQVRSTASQTAQNAQGVVDLSQRTTTVSGLGEEAVSNSIDGMQQVKKKVETIANNILTLSEQSQAIGAIIATVNDIASQSNMLALNASVEAARAGEAGRGFAVVAGEVRSLAEQSRAATVQVREILEQIQRGVNTAVMATEEGMKGTDAGLMLTERAGAAFRQLAESAAESASAAEQIAVAAQQQLTGIEQIAQAMQNIHQVTAQTVTSARQSEQAAEELNRLPGHLRQVVVEYSPAE